MQFYWSNLLRSKTLWNVASYSCSGMSEDEFHQYNIIYTKALIEWNNRRLSWATATSIAHANKPVQSDYNFTTDGTKRPAFSRAGGDRKWLHVKRFSADGSLERLAIRRASSSRAIVRERSGVVWHRRRTATYFPSRTFTTSVKHVHSFTLINSSALM